MWTFFSGGFISIVQHSERPDTLIVRARDEDSLLSLVEATGATLRHTPKNDYPIRLQVSRGALAAWVSGEISNLNYTNYKAHMGSARPEFADSLGIVWATMHGVEEPRVTEEDRERAANLYPNQKWTDGDIEMLKGLGHI